MAEDDPFRIAELLLQGFKCSHVLMKLALDAQGREDPDLVRVMSGLALGLGRGFNCGALSGACCVLGLYSGQSDADAGDDPSLPFMLDEVVDWFIAHTKERYGSINCSDIMKFDPALRQERCPALILGAWQKTVEALEKYGFDVSQPPPSDAEAGV